MELRYAIRIVNEKVNVGRANTIEKARSIKASLETDDLEDGENIIYEIYDMLERQVIEEKEE